MSSRRRVPVWMMGLTNLMYGLYGGVVAFAVPQLLGERHVSETTIAGLTAVAISPGFWSFVLSPMLDVRFSRRWYATVLAVVASLTLVMAFLNLSVWGCRSRTCFTSTPSASRMEASAVVWPPMQSRVFLRAFCWVRCWCGWRANPKPCRCDRGRKMKTRRPPGWAAFEL